MKITSFNISFYPTSRISLTIHKTTLTVEYSVWNEYVKINRKRWIEKHKEMISLLLILIQHGRL